MHPDQAPQLLPVQATNGGQVRDLCSATVPVASVTAKIACALALIDPSNHRPAPI